MNTEPSKAESCEHSTYIKITSFAASRFAQKLMMEGEEGRYTKASIFQLHYYSNRI